VTQLSKHQMYYVALICPEETDKKVNQFKIWMKQHFGCVIALKSPAHITLIPPFWLEQERETQLLKTLQLFSSDQGNIEIELEGFSHFGKSVLFLVVKDNPLLQDLQNQVMKYFQEPFNEVIKNNDRPFHPHITIATRDLKPGDLRKALEHFNNEKYFHSFQTKSISVLKLSPGKWNVLASVDWR